MKPFLRRLAPWGLLLLATSTGAAGPAEPASEAASAYAQGRYADAVRAYEGIAESEGVSASLYYDLGAAQLAAGEIGPAVLSFERAHWLAPSDAGVASALRAAREKANLAAIDTPWWRPLRDVASPDGWALVAWLALAFGCAGASLALLPPALLGSAPRARRALHGAAFAGVGAFLVAALACASLAAETSRGIAIGSDLALRIAPFAEAESRGSVLTGEAVRLEERHGDFVRVRADGGRAGWVPMRSVGAVGPG
jgi:tetratricopeptide (TPR) repeat protein